MKKVTLLFLITALVVVNFTINLRTDSHFEVSLSDLAAVAQSDDEGEEQDEEEEENPWWDMDGDGFVDAIDQSVWQEFGQQCLDACQRAGDALNITGIEVSATTGDGVTYTDPCDGRWQVCWH